MVSHFHFLHYLQILIYGITVWNTLRTFDSIVAFKDSCNEVNIVGPEKGNYEYCRVCVLTKRSDVKATSYCKFILSEFGYSCGRDDGAEGITSVFINQKDCTAKFQPGPVPPDPPSPTPDPQDNGGFSWAWFFFGILFIATISVGSFFIFKKYKSQVITTTYEDI